MTNAAPQCHTAAAGVEQGHPAAAGAERGRPAARVALAVVAAHRTGQPLHARYLAAQAGT